MPQNSPILSLPLIQPAQAQKHVTHNEALRILDAVTQLSVIDATLTTPPATPAEGDRYIVAGPATDAWAGQEAQIAVWADGTWQYFAPATGWRADVQTDGSELRFDGTDWQGTGGAVSLQNVPMVGIQTSADATNRLASAADATLLTHAGGGHQLKINKNAAGDTNSLLFQTGWSGRAEMGTTGSDDFAVKVSADGTVFNTALIMEAGSGAVQAPSGQVFFRDEFIGDDAAWSIDVPFSDPARIMMWLSTDQGGHAFLFSITGALAGAGNFGEIFANPTGVLTYAGGALTGTTTPDEGIGISIDAGGAVPRLYLENRLGTGQTFTLATLGR